MGATLVMTAEEEDRLLDEYGKALLRGDDDAADEISMKLPIHKALVPWVRDCFSEEEIKEMGLILPD